jgi:hypothetical protein
VEVVPTLVIGLGGSGTWTARRLKKLMRQRYGIIPLIRFLFLDCDQGAFTSEPELADVQDDEKVALVIRNPEQIWQEVWQGKIEERAKWRDWLPEKLNVGTLRGARGAGGIRPVGRFALFASLQEVWGRLDSALRDILAIEQQLRATLGDQAERVTVRYSEPCIYIVGSLCGGTGSSLFLDIAVLVRHCLRQIASDAQPSIVGVFFLPSVFASEPNIRSDIDLLRANGYAALKELEYFCDGMALQSQPFTFRYPLIGDVTVNAPVYDEAFVVEDGTPDGSHLNSKEEVFEMVARSLLVDIGLPFGSRHRSRLVDIKARLPMSPCPQTGRERLIHSLGMTSVAVPIAEIVKRGALQRLRQFLNDHALGQGLSADELKGEVDSFLQANQLEERGNRNDLLERLLTRDGEVLTYTLTRTREELEREAGGSELQQAHYVATWIEQEMNRLRTQLQVTTSPCNFLNCSTSAAKSAGTRLISSLGKRSILLVAANALSTPARRASSMMPALRKRTSGTITAGAIHKISFCHLSKPALSVMLWTNSIKFGSARFLINQTAKPKQMPEVTAAATATLQSSPVMALTSLNQTVVSGCWCSHQ